MKLIQSRQESVLFLFCPSPVTIDKRKSWGDSDANFQKAPNGAFLKVLNDNIVSSLVQPNEDKTAPVGWVATSTPGYFKKAPIWVGRRVESGEKVSIKTLDSPEPIEYTATEESYICYNDLNGSPDIDDCWIQKGSALAKNYYFD